MLWIILPHLLPLMEEIFLHLDEVLALRELDYSVEVLCILPVAFFILMFNIGTLMKFLFLLKLLLLPHLEVLSLLAKEGRLNWLEGILLVTTRGGIFSFEVAARGCGCLEIVGRRVGNHR